MALINCNATYEIDIPGCTPEIRLLAPKKNILYTLKFTFANGFTLSIKKTSNSSTSIITLTKDADLNGFWNDGTGQVILQLFEGSTCDPAINTFCTLEYSQIVINFKPIDTNDTYTSIPCTCS
jgi:hypothetical protein